LHPPTRFTCERIRTLPTVETSPDHFPLFIDDFIGFNRVTDYILASMILSLLLNILTSIRRGDVKIEEI